MNVFPEVAEPEPSLPGRQDAPRAWLDALADGACNPDAFLRGVDALVETAPDAVWETLSLIDQYYRRKKIGPELFRSLNLHLQGRALRPRRGGERSVPTPLVFRQPDVVRRAPTAVPPEEAVVPATATASGVGEPAVARPPPGAYEPTARHVWGAGDVVRGRYRLVKTLGQGATGATFEAIDLQRADLPNVDQRLAVKVLHPEVSERADRLAEVRRAFCIQQSLSHPNILRMFEFDRDGDTAFFTMELLSGFPLSRLLDGRNGAPLERQSALPVIYAVGTALTHAHSHSVVHGDLRPRRVFLSDEGDVRVSGFGARTVTRRPRPFDFELPQQPPGSAEERADGQIHSDSAVDPGDDLFSFACFAYWMLTGMRPFGRCTAAEARGLRRQLRRPAALTQRQWHPLRAALDVEPGRIRSDVGEFLRRLEPSSPTSRVSPRRLPVAGGIRGHVLMIAAVGGGLVALAAGGGLWLRSDPFVRTLVVTRMKTSVVRAVALAGTFVRHPRDEKSVGGGIVPADAGNPSSIAPVSFAHAPEAPEAPAALQAPQAPHAQKAARPPRPALKSAVGPARVELAASLVEVSLTEPVARVRVRRSGKLGGEASFTWWTESGTAKPGDDYVGYPPTVEKIRGAEDGVNLLIPIVSDPARREAKSFYVIIDEVSSGASLGERTVTMITIPAPE